MALGEIGKVHCDINAETISLSGHAEVEGFHLKLWYIGIQGRPTTGDRRFGHLGLCDTGHGWELQHPGFISCGSDSRWLLFFGHRMILIDEDRHLQRMISALF